MAPAWWGKEAGDHGHGAEHEKEYKSFWDDACLYGDFAHWIICGGFVTHAERVYYSGEPWFGRFADASMSEDECPRGEYGEYAHPGMKVWYKLAQEALDQLCDLSCPPVVIVTPYDEEQLGSNPWVNWLYTSFAPAPERHEAEAEGGYASHPLLCEPGEWFEVAGLACNVFLASARLIETLADTSLWELFKQRQSARQEAAPPRDEQMIQQRASDRASTVRPLHDVQKAILRVLDGRALKKEALANVLQLDPSRLYRPGGIRELMKTGKVLNLPGIGYYRPDAPPPDAMELTLQPKSPQVAPNSSPPVPN